MLFLYFVVRIRRRRKKFTFAISSADEFLVSERERVRYMSSCVRLSVVCRRYVTFVHPTQAIEIFGNVSTPFNTLVI